MSLDSNLDLPLAKATKLKPTLRTESFCAPVECVGLGCSETF